MKENFDALMRAQIEKFTGEEGGGAGAARPRRPKLLLHCCCAPCSSACLERLKDYFDITALFYNPNIEQGEYEKRKAELKKLLAATGWADFLDCDYDGGKFYDCARGLEGEKEGGARCEKCFYLRLEKTAETAKAGNYDFFTTTLTISPLKNAALINKIGLDLGGEKWLFSDFKKGGGALRSIQLSKEYGLYRQNYCGCVYSRTEAEKRGK